MLVNSNQTKSTADHRQFFRKPMTKKIPLYRIDGKAQFGFDDYLNQLAVMKEQGSLIISGRRIC
jgi:hypothetical protein